MQTGICSRSPQSPSPNVLLKSRLQKGQQGVESKILAREAGKSKLLARAGSTGARARLAQASSVLLEKAPKAEALKLRYKMT